ncbi:hypothetical protein GINT2_000304 [Glugoides intestinalis]
MEKHIDISKDFIDSQLKKIKKMFCKKSGQFMVVGVDKYVVDRVIDELGLNSEYSVVKVKCKKDLTPHRKLYILPLENNSSITYQSLLYYYLELPRQHECFVCFVSTSSLSLDFFEKRVRSRFKDRVFFIPYLPNAQLHNEHPGSISDLPATVCSVESYNQVKFMKKYNLRNYTLEFVFEMLEPIHFVLLSIAFTQKLNMKKSFELFKVATINTPELKKISSVKVLFALFDLLEASLINTSGLPCVDFVEFKAFVNKNCPHYLKTLIKSQQAS